jgi:hypothetical protein
VEYVAACAKLVRHRTLNRKTILVKYHLLFMMLSSKRRSIPSVRSGYVPLAYAQRYSRFLGGVLACFQTVLTVFIYRVGGGGS